MDFNELAQALSTPLETSKQTIAPGGIGYTRPATKKQQTDMQGLSESDWIQHLIELFQQQQMQQQQGMMGMMPGMQPPQAAAPQAGGLDLMALLGGMNAGQ